ncbi:nuclease-related domain-containing protein [Ammoniphilus sp. YIM 78166]|uniref:nuclease-related domain-containing protein n=1 Tax=Ammoniphilus sp. YIM 78166 TaxID=1644106 RepID=UPI001431BE29|nr:nuclease-related domain-containing protein [Ammoniphilus sp. YIM 78166]
MFIKPRTTPEIILKLQALHRRLDPTHKKQPLILQDLLKRKRGYKGEQNLDKYLEYLPQKDYLFLCDLNLIADHRAFQIDTLVISPYLIIIIESKNFFGTLFFDQHTKQMLRTYKGETEAFPDPITQTHRQRIQLLHWFQENKIRPAPIETLVSIGDPSTILQTNPGQHEIFKKILQAEQIPERIQQLEQESKDKILTPYMLQRISECILAQLQPPDTTDILEKYNIPSTELLQGVRCPSCAHIPIHRTHGNWYCPRCHQQKQKAHQQTIRDHLHLTASLSNKQCRKLLQINSINTTTRLLNAMELSTKGIGKAKTYHLST